MAQLAFQAGRPQAPLPAKRIGTSTDMAKSQWVRMASMLPSKASSCLRASFSSCGLILITAVDLFVVEQAVKYAIRAIDRLQVLTVKRVEADDKYLRFRSG